MFRSLTDAVAIVDARLNVLRSNPAARSILAKVAPQGIVLVHAFVDAQGKVFEASDHPLERALAGATPERDVVLGVAPPNAPQWFVANVEPVYVAGTIARAVLYLCDITDEAGGDGDAGAFAQRLRTLHDISSAPVASDRERVERALRFVLSELELDQAYLGALDRESGELVIQNVVARDCAPTYGPGKRYPADKTLIGRVIDSGLVLASPDVVATRRAYGIAYTDEWHAYIAVRIAIAGEPYGVIGFKSRQVRRQPFSPIDVELVHVTGDLVAASVEREMQRARLDALAFHDALTGLPNRVVLTDRLEQCVLAARRQETRFALLFIDLDGFKAVNDRLGHAAGDAVLKGFATQLTRFAREGDTVARLGGDEFVILAPNIDTERDALEIAQRIAEHVNRDPTANDGIAVTASIGVSVFPDHGPDADVLLARADAAMFEAKLHGKRGIRIASKNPQRETPAPPAI